MLKAYKYRLSPNNEQKELINKHIGSCRFLYNLALETRQVAYSGNKKSLTFYDLANQIPDLKEECTWLKEVNSQSLQESLRHLESAFKNFFKGQSKFPNFKSKNKGNQSFQIPQHVKVDFENNKLFFPKFKEGINIILHRKFKGQIKTITISKTPTRKYFVSILVDNKKEFPEKKKILKETSVGIDLGLHSFLVTSDGLKIDNPRYLRHGLERIKVLQHRMRNQKKGSKKQKKSYKKIAVLYERISNQRKDFLHKLSTDIVKNHDTICVENLNIQGMVKNHNLAQSISDAGWGMFIGFVEYKSEWQGKNVLQIGRWDASSKTCCNCGEINHSLTLTDREWTCKKCRTKHDRDECAAKNIENFALKNSGTECAGVPVKSPTLVGTMKREILHI